MVVNDQDGGCHGSMVSSKHTAVLRASPETNFHARTDVQPTLAP